VPFHKFADLVKNQVKKLNEDGDAEVAFAWRSGREI
jgi:hypothetical protein